MSKHTPGPWRWTMAAGGTGSPTIVALDGDRIRSEVAGKKVAMTFADASLIAAAPELLAICKEFVRRCEDGEVRSRRTYAQMKAVIAKAEGQHVSA